MNPSTSLRFLCAAAAFGITASLFGAVCHLANVPTEAGVTTLMALSQQPNQAAREDFAMADQD
jgi:hypothetical protein